MTFSRPTAYRIGLRFALLAGLLAPPRIYALFGVGDIVYDPTSVAQMIDLVNQAKQQYDRLGSLLGVSTHQLDQLVLLAGALGNPTEAAAFTRASTPAELQGMVQTVPGLETATVDQLFRPDGTLDAFLGLPVATWIAAIENPQKYFRAALIQPASARVAEAIGLPGLSAARYSQWYGTLSAEDQLNLAPRAAADLAGLMGADWMEGARGRRTNLQTLAIGNQSDAQSASQALTLSDQAGAHAKLAVRSNQILLETAAQAAAAQEATLRAVGAQHALLNADRDERRDAAEMLLDGPG
jgi:hypothetical protein